MNQKVLVKEGRREISKWDQTIQAKQDIPKQRKKNFSAIRGGARRHKNDLMTREKKKFPAKYGNKENITEKPNGLATWEKS